MKKLPLTILAGFVIVLSCVILSCNKNQCEPCGSNYKTIPQEMKDWALFGEGSWWVYRLAEDTTVFDTVRFSSRSDFRSNLTTCDDNHAPSIGCSETITYHLKHSNKNYFSYSDEIVLYYPPGGGVFLDYYGGSFGGGVILGINPIKINEYYGNFTLIDTFKNLKINNLTFDNIFHSSIVTNNTPPGYLMKDIYWGKHIGILKIEVPPNQTWELINYDVKQ
jgi:hypothetical protein